jgi:hypothetical protein
MSKMDDMRAMREARYQRDQARAGSQARPAQRPVAPRAADATAPKTKPAKADPVADAAGADGGEQLCGHRNMSGRTCTREHGHAAKSHRYS